MQPTLVALQVKIQEPESGKAEHRIEPGAGVRHEQLILPDIEYDPFVRDRITERVKNLCSNSRNVLFQRQRHCIDDKARKGNQVQDEKQHEPQGAQTWPSPHREQYASKDWDQRTNLE